MKILEDLAKKSSKISSQLVQEETTLEAEGLPILKQEWNTIVAEAWDEDRVYVLLLRDHLLSSLLQDA